MMSAREIRLTLAMESQQRPGHGRWCTCGDCDPYGENRAYLNRQEEKRRPRRVTEDDIP